MNYQEKIKRLEHEIAILKTKDASILKAIKELKEEIKKIKGHKPKQEGRRGFIFR